MNLYNIILKILGMPEFDLPYDYNPQGIYRLLEDRYNFLNEQLNLLDKTNNRNDFLISNIKKITNNLLIGIEKYLLGNKDDAQKIIITLLDNMKDSIINVSNYYNKHQHYIYYKARAPKESEKITDRKEMFHKPYDNKNYQVATRYGYKNHPCLYLGGTTYTCYCELEHNTTDLYFSRFELPKDYKLITIGLLPYEFKTLLFKDTCLTDEAKNSFAEDYLKMLPIIMACSIRKNVCEIEHNEYIVPQIIMRWLINNFDKFDGITYFSNAVPIHSRYNRKLYQNIVIPIKTEPVFQEYCPKLKKEIKLTNPILVKSENLMKEFKGSTCCEFRDPDFLGKSMGRIQCSNNNGEIHYSSSGFHEVEYELSKLLLDNIT